jgi:hypothetical protein
VLTLQRTKEAAYSTSLEDNKLVIVVQPLNTNFYYAITAKQDNATTPIKKNRLIKALLSKCAT